MRAGVPEFPVTGCLWGKYTHLAKATAHPALKLGNLGNKRFCTFRGDVGAVSRFESRLGSAVLRSRTVNNCAHKKLPTVNPTTGLYLYIMIRCKLEMPKQGYPLLPLDRDMEAAPRAQTRYPSSRTGIAHRQRCTEALDSICLEARPVVPDGRGAQGGSPRPFSVQLMQAKEAHPKQLASQERQLITA